MERTRLILVRATCDAAFTVDLAARLDSLGIEVEVRPLDEPLSHHNVPPAAVTGLVLSARAIRSVGEARLCTVAGFARPVLPIVLGPCSLPACFANSSRAAFMEDGTYWLGIEAILAHLKRPNGGHHAPLAVPKRCPVDEGGRMALPEPLYAAFIGEPGGNGVVTVSLLNRCLTLYSFRDWRKVEEGIGQLPTFDAQGQALHHLLLGHACEVDIEGDGSFRIPGNLREWANIGRAAVVIGLGRWIEIWSSEDFGYALSKWELQRETATKA